MCRAYDHLFTVTSEDREHLLALYPGAERDAAAAKFTVIPICVDPTQVAPAPRAPAAYPRSCTWARCFGRRTLPA